MRNLIGTAVALSLLFIPGCYTRVVGGPSVSVSVTAGYSSCEDDDDMDRDELIYIDKTRVGFWLALPSGGWVFRCRSMWYDTEWAVWKYGPWYNNHSISYTCHCHDHYQHYCPFHGVRFHVYMSNHYPKYHHKHFYRYYHRPHHHQYYHKGHGHKGHGNHGHLGSGNKFQKHSASPVAPKPHKIHPVRPESSYERAPIIRTNEIRPSRVDNGNKVYKIDDNLGGGNGRINKVQGSAERGRSPLGSNNQIRRNDARRQLGNR